MPRQNKKRAGQAPPVPPPTSPTKPPKAPKRAWEEFSQGAASFFSSQVSDAKARGGGTLVGNEAERVCIGLPLVNSFEF